MNPSTTVPRLLVVEDDPVSREFLAQALASVPAHVDATDTIAGALRLAGLQRHDAWLIDAHLPDGSGEQCLQALRGSHPGIPALAVTAAAFADELAPLCAAGFLEVIQKPVTAAVLQACVARMLFGAPLPIPTEGDAKLPIWDESAALAALAGNSAALTSLRAMFFAELPKDARLACAAWDRHEEAELRAILHRLRASTGFVGAARLGQAVHRWSQSPADPARRKAFEWAVDDLLAGRD